MICVECELTFEPTIRGGVRQRFCSALCRGRFGRKKRTPKRPVFNCLECGVVVDPATGRTQPRKKFCSIVCAGKHRRKSLPVEVKRLYVKTRKERVLANPERYAVAEANRRKQLKEKASEYAFTRKNKQRGLNNDQFYLVYDYQNNSCAICGHEFTHRDDRNLARDHDHNSGLFRGLLCNYCNMFLGFLEKRSFNIQSFLDYVDDPPAKKVLK